MPNLDAVRREAIYAAEILLAQRDVGPADRLNVFDAIEDQGIWLSFGPLTALYGWYQRTPDAAGIMINASHPPPLQRFTAAHELGHHLLGHSDSFDDAQSIVDGGGADDPKEVAAQTFAANLLMPIMAVEHHLARLGLDRTHPVVSRADAYRLSVELGVSYAATVVQLASLNKIDWHLAAELRSVRPLAIKREIGGREPDQARAAVWLLGESDQERHIIADIGDEVHIRLGEVRSSGFRWVLNQSGVPGFSVVGDFLDQNTSTGQLRYGAAHFRHLVLKVTAPGDHALSVSLRRPWQRDVAPSRRYDIFVTAEAPRTSDVGRGVSIYQQPQLMAA